MRKKAISAMLCATLLASMLTGCGAEKAVEAGTGKVDTIVMSMPTLGEAPADLEKIEDAINAITEEKIGVHLVMEPIPFSDLSKTQNLMISSGDQLDVVLSLWEGGIGSYAEKGAVIDLTDLIDEYGKDIVEAVGPSIAGGYYNETLYGVPDGELWGHQYGFYARKDIVEELGFSYDNDTLYTVEDLEALFQAYKDKYGDGYYCVAGTTPNSEFFNYLSGHPDGMGASSVGYACGGLVDCLDKTNTTIENVYASDEYMAYAEKTTITQVSSACGTEMVPITLVSPYAATSMYQSIQWGISSNCETPEKAMQMLNMLYADPEVLSLLMYGIEDEHYVVETQGEGYKKVVTFPEGTDSMNSTYYVTLGVFGDHALYPVWSPDTLDSYELITEFNDIVSVEDCQSVALNYAYNYDDLSTAYSAVSAVISQYSGAIATGSVDPAKEIPEFVKALEDAGINDLIDANQIQFNEWLEKNK